jgi:hypothetical protein
MRIKPQTFSGPVHFMQSPSGFWWARRSRVKGTAEATVVIARQEQISAFLYDCGFPSRRIGRNASSPRT